MISRLLSVVALTVAVAPLAAQRGAPGGPVPVELLSQRRALLLDSMPSGILVIKSGKIRSIEGDYPQDADYRENSDFFYLTGLEAPGGILVISQPEESGQAAALTLYLPAPPTKRDNVSAARSYADEESKLASGISDIRDRPAPARRGADDPFAAIIDTVGQGAGLERLNARVVLGPLRQIKDADEVRRLRMASSITAEAHREVMLTTRPGMWEYEIEATVEYNFRKGGAERLGYPSIVGSGINSTILHYDLSRRQTAPGDILLIDAGAEFGYYSTDLTRTFPVDGKFTDRQKEIYDLVLGAQQAAIDSVRPGTTMARLSQISRGYMDSHSGTICGDEPCTRYFIHGLGHWVGMEVHDVGPYFVDLEPGMTLTIEPGIYIPEEELGVRIEDVVLVTDDGSENLTVAAPRTTDAIEALMAKGRSQDR